MTTTPRRAVHGLWSSHWIFVLAATGAAVGLGNVWKFPYIAGENGGGAFVLIYLACILLVGIPLMMAEILIGRRGRQNPVNAMKNVAMDEHQNIPWKVVGALIVLAGFLILSYYSVVAGWAVAYVVFAAKGLFVGADAKTISDLFTHFIASPWRLLFWHTLIMLATTCVIARGVRKGIEKMVLWIFPIMILLLLTLVIYAMTCGHFLEGVRFLFACDVSKLSTDGVLDALGHAFFTLSLATGSIMMYGAYLPNQASVVKASVTIALADTFVALLAGLAIFPIVFAEQLSPGAGPGLIFQTLPVAFGQMSHGYIFSCVFFIVLVLAAFTSTVSLLEPSVAWFIEHFHSSRQRAAWIIGSCVWLLGIITVLSFNEWQHITLFDLDLFDLLDYLTANIMLPLGGLCIAIFVGWFVKREDLLDELRLNDGWLFCKWYWTIRYISPVAIILVCLKAIGLL